MPPLTLRLAEHALSIDVARLGPRLRQDVLRCVFDLLIVAMAGHRSDGPAAATQALPLLYGAGTAPIWFRGQTSSILGALLVNGLAASALDLDDGNRAARGHPGASTIPAVLTLAAVMEDVSVDDVTSAIIAGYDVGVRIAAAQQPDAIRTRQTGRWAAFAACAAAGRLMKLPRAQLAEALAIAGVLAPNQRANGSSGYSKQTGNMVKEGIAHSAQTGVQALFLARCGFDGPIDILDHPGFYDPEIMLKGLGADFLISDSYFKPYACCRYIHPALDAFLSLQKARGFTGDMVSAIRVHSFNQALRLQNMRDPDNMVALQYSLPFCLAIVAREGERALLSPNRALLGRRDLVALAHRIELVADDEAEACFPGETWARLDIELNSGERLTSPLIGARGDPGEPLTDAEHRQKFFLATSSGFSAFEQSAALSSLDRLACGDLTPLLTFLARRPGAS